MKSRLVRRFTALIFLLSTCTLQSQEATPGRDQQERGLADSIQQLTTEVRELESAVTEMRAESLRLRNEVVELRRELLVERGQTTSARDLQASGLPVSSANAAPESTESANTPPQQVNSETPSNQSERVAKLEEEYQLLSGKVDDQYQSKVESASKYKVRLSGIVLLNLFSTRGSADNVDLPNYWTFPVTPPESHSFGGTIRQSQLGLEVFGPELLAAKTSGEIKFDFAGGFPSVANGTTFGIARLRTGTVHIDWPHTSIIAGQDSLFFSPESPTSLASLAIPALSYAGNLWAWVPQLRVEQRFDLKGDSNLRLQAGILDNLTGESPVGSYRSPLAGERSGQPAYALRASWNRTTFGLPLTVGAAGYYSRQNWGPGHNVEGWAGMTDWSLPLSKWVALSGKFYRGKALGGLGGGVGRSVLFSQDMSRLQPLDSEGGWAQLKFRATSKLEFNGAAGQDNPFAHQIRGFAISASDVPSLLTRNQAWLVNFIYRPRSDLLFSTEYKHIRTFVGNAGDDTVGQANVGMGILF